MPKSTLYKFFGFKHLIKAILSISHAASSDWIVCNASNSLMIERCPSWSGVAIEKGTVVIGNGKASIGFRGMSKISPNA